MYDNEIGCPKVCGLLRIKQKIFSHFYVGVYSVVDEKRVKRWIKKILFGRFYENSTKSRD